MALIPHLQGLGATHLFTLNNEGTNTTDDYGNSVDPTNIITGTYSFVTDPVCYGFTHSLRSTSDSSVNVDSATWDNRMDINASNGAGNDSSSYNYSTGSRTVILWCTQKEIWNATCIFEQGGGTNNFAIMGGAQVTFQAADAGQPFLIGVGKTLSVAGRPLFIVGVWQHHTQHSGSGNRVLLYINGVLQDIHEDTGTAAMPAHSGDITIGNSADALKTFNESAMESQTTAKDTNLFGMFNNVSLTEAQCRDIFERTVLPEHLITGTKAQQQASLDALSGTTFQDVNCAIEIRQATDEAGDYSLDLNDIQFVENANLRDIAVQYVGPNTLTIVNRGVSNAVEVSRPVEKDLDGSTIILGGGTLEVLNPAEITLTGIPVGLEVRIRAGTSTLAHDANVQGGSFSYEYAFPHDRNVRISIGGLTDAGVSYERFTFDFTLTTQSQTLPVDLSLNPSYQ